MNRIGWSSRNREEDEDVKQEETDSGKKRSPTSSPRVLSIRGSAIFLFYFNGHRCPPYSSWTTSTWTSSDHSGTRLCVYCIHSAIHSWSPWWSFFPCLCQLESSSLILRSCLPSLAVSSVFYFPVTSDLFWPLIIICECNTLFHLEISLCHTNESFQLE